MWIETRFECDPIDAVRRVLSSHATGQLVLHFSEGTVRVVVWREKETPPNNFVDTGKNDCKVIA